MAKVLTTLAAGRHEDMKKSAAEAVDMLRALAHEYRLMILCVLADGEKSVGEIETILGMRQAAVSQQLTRLRADNLVDRRRDGKTIYYRLASSKARSVITTLYELYCADRQEA